MVGKSLDESINLALVIGNSRLHWALLSTKGVIGSWDTDYLNDAAIAHHLSPSSPHLPLLSSLLSPLSSLLSPLSSLLPLLSSLLPPPSSLLPLLSPLLPPPSSLLTLAPANIPHLTTITPPLLLASVVPHETERWQRHIDTHLITLEHVPLQGLYPTLGIDRALAVLGAGERYGFPVLVIDGGTALTLTGVDGDRRLVGGAILPGLHSQGRSLTTHTAALPDIQFDPQETVPRWATRTDDAIRSGILYTALAGISDFVRHWRYAYPGSPVIFTGGDGQMLLVKAQNSHPHLAIGVAFDATLVFEGMRVVKLSCSVSSS